MEFTMDESEIEDGGGIRRYMDAPNFQRTGPILQAGQTISLEFWGRTDGDMPNITQAESQYALRQDSPQPSFQHLHYGSPGGSSGCGGLIYIWVRKAHESDLTFRYLARFMPFPALGRTF
jgi:hypothetical protein